MASEKYDKSAIGKRIKSIRLEKGMTLEEFGNLFGADKSNVLKWEKGSSIPSPERLKLISKIGDITVDELLRGSKIEYAVSLCNSLIQKSSAKSFVNKTLIEKYSNQFVEYIRHSLKSLDLSDITYNDIDRFVITNFNEFLTTPTNTKQLISSVISGNLSKIKKIHDFISYSPTIEDDLLISSIEEIDKNIAKRIIEILENSNSELFKLKNELKQ